jgi:hypothetical protein
MGFNAPPAWIGVLVAIRRVGAPVLIHWLYYGGERAPVTDEKGTSNGNSSEQTEGKE